MTTLQGQIEKMARDVTSGPDLSDSIEVAVVGAVLGAAVGFFKDKRSAKSFAVWGAGLSIAGQYMLFHMLKPSFRHAFTSHRVGNGGVPSTSAPICSPGTYWDDYYKKCLASHLPLTQTMPPTLSDWEKQHVAAGGDIYTGAVNRGGFRGGAGMPFGPGPWPTQYSSELIPGRAFDPNAVTNDSNALEGAGWG